MAQPTLSQVHVNRPLTNISQAYMQDARDFIADKIFPVVPVQKRSDLYFVYTKGFWFRDEAQKRAPATESAGGGYGLTTGSYSTDVYAFHMDVDEQVRANTDDPLNADRDATLFVTQRMLLKREVLVSAAVFATTTWTGSTTGNDIVPSPKWDAANNTVLEDIEAQVWAIKSLTGKFPNRLFLGAHVWQALKNDAEIIDRIKYTQRGIDTPQILASLLAPPGVDDFQVVVAAAIINSAQEGIADSFAFIAPQKDAILLYAEPQPGIMRPSSGYLFTWTGLLGAGAFGSVIAQIPMPWLGTGTVRIEGQIAFVPSLVGVDLGAYFHNAVTT